MMEGNQSPHRIFYICWSRLGKTKLLLTFSILKSTKNQMKWPLGSRIKRIKQSKQTKQTVIHAVYMKREYCALLGFRLIVSITSQCKIEHQHFWLFFFVVFFFCIQSAKLLYCIRIRKYRYIVCYLVYDVAVVVNSNKNWALSVYWD